MTERRRPLENDDGQGALFGGEAFAPAGPVPAWKRPSRPDNGAPASADAPPFEARVDAPAPQAFGEGAGASRGFEPGAPRPADADLDAPHAFEPAEDPAARALEPGRAEPVPGSPFADEIAELERATEDQAPRRPRAPLAGPTLDDVMSRVWEGLTTGLPAACPVCHGEVVPALSGPPHGRCSSCGTTID
jgi:hypothetical protein